jgi:hypothetical protein
MKVHMIIPIHARSLLTLAMSVSLIATAWAEDKIKHAYPVQEFGFSRLFQQARQDPKWSESIVADRMLLVRSYALKESVVSDPVSDRYAITCYGGSIDLVHFFCLAADICSGKHDLGERLYREWVDEGGRENQEKFNDREPPEAHPDDLPSNALGALFGLEMMGRVNDQDFDLEEAFGDFISSLLPLPDSIAKEFSHSEIVMGLPENPSRKLIEERYGWFTASPLVCCRAINLVAIKKQGKPVCRNVDTGLQALALAGFKIFSFKDQPIIIRRATKPNYR